MLFSILLKMRSYVDPVLLVQWIWEHAEGHLAKLTVIGAIVALLWKYISTVASTVWKWLEAWHSPVRVQRRRYREIAAELDASRQELHDYRLRGRSAESEAQIKFYETKIANLEECRTNLCTQLREEGHEPSC